MDTPVDSSTSAIASSSAAEDMSSVYVHGAVSGVVGAVTVALWFLYIDFTHGRLLYTPTVLGMVLFGRRTGLASPDTLSVSLPMTVMFTVVHLAVFVVIGIAAARLLDMFEHRVNVLLAIALLFVILGLGFLAFAMTFAALPFEVLSWPDVFLGNLFAAAAMSAHLFRARPHRAAA
jgi:hypothetical protein